MTWPLSLCGVDKTRASIVPVRTPTSCCDAGCYRHHGDPFPCTKLLSQGAPASSSRGAIIARLRFSLQNFFPDSALRAITVSRGWMFSALSSK